MIPYSRKKSQFYLKARYNVPARASSLTEAPKKHLRKERSSP
ncbi:hypothetical protein GCWU000341_00652 [Oribacterium sp. oral taxon 078 str. F0262]|nr:hypothetical protein GCWU000341_00652 [Oribacterium sp. oral taxon 078 str. F0262]